ncbi:transposase [Alienimonas californiensis]|uniref:Insertion element IS402-like domain-containing protein n=1 Tax=Alienimonas californiensis TaxID=2527989 RepID=A0A517P6T6_9PLAN|nr:transposase [Alienimonas californiensis]QDT15085.1 hypothetical protein CA12_11650 [Alienimonas californiensis]
MPDDEKPHGPSWPPKLTDEEWTAVRPLLHSQGRPGKYDREFVNAIFWMLHQNDKEHEKDEESWRSFAPHDGLWNTLARRYKRWETSGELEAFLGRVRKASEEGRIPWHRREPEGERRRFRSRPELPSREG